VGGFLLPFQAERIRELYPKEVLATLQAISDGDSDAVSIAKWVNEKPDLSSEQWQSQMESQDQREIENSGFERWLKNEKLSRSFVKKSSPEAYARRVEYVKRMRAWAKEHGFLKE
jgi:hypothetical protein